MATVSEKHCSLCKEAKASDCFGTNRRSKTGLRPECNECRRHRSRQLQKSRAKPCRMCGKEFDRRVDGHRSRPVRYCSLECAFRKHVNAVGPTDCWDWMFTRDENGYGQFAFRGVMRKAHRVSLEIAIGRPIADGMGALHSCDRPCCVNPSHLREGTQKDNYDDCKTRGRASAPPRVHKVGAARHNARFTEEQVRRILVMSAGGFSSTQIGRALGVPQATISAICIRRSWKHLVFDPFDQAA